MHLTLWIVAGLLATVYLVAGVGKLIVPKETLAASGLVVLMAGAMFTRIRRREVKPLLADVTFLVLVSFVAWGRFGSESFTA